MTTARFFSGVSLFALLIMNICCAPVKKAFKKAAAPASSQFLPADEEEMLTVESSSVQFLSAPPGSEFKAGELSHYEDSYAYADHERETEDRGYRPPPPPPPPMRTSSASQLTSQPQPLPGLWIFYPSDHVLLKGQYPPGTLTHFISSFEQGRDHWQDTLDVSASPADEPDPAEQTEPEAPESFEDPQFPVKTESGDGQPAVSRGFTDARAVIYYYD